MGPADQRPITRIRLWRVLIFLGTVFCVVMLFAPLLREMLMRLMRAAESPFP